MSYPLSQTQKVPINEQFKIAAYAGNIEEIHKIWKHASDEILVDVVDHVCFNLALDQDITTFVELFRLTYYPKLSSAYIERWLTYVIDNNEIQAMRIILQYACTIIHFPTRKLRKLVTFAISKGNTDAIDTIWQYSKFLAPHSFDEISSTLLSSFKIAASNGKVKILSKIFELFNGKIPKDVISAGFLYAANHGKVRTLSKIWKLDSKGISKEIVYMGLLTCARNNSKTKFFKMLKFAKNKIFKNKIPTELNFDANNHQEEAISSEMAKFVIKHSSGETIHQITLEAYKSANVLAINILVDLGLFSKNGTKLIGLTNSNGWIFAITDYIDKYTDFNVMALTKENTEDLKLLSLFDGFINPGGDNTFQVTASYKAGIPVSIEYLYNEDHHMDHEYAYQNVINYSQKHNVPLLNVCGGTQQFILNNGGLIDKTKTYHGDVGHTLKVISGSIIHFLVMNKYEQSLAITQGYFPEIEFPIVTLHSDAGVKDNIGNLELGGVSDEGEVEAVAKNFYQVGLQFHSEQKVNEERNSILLANIFQNFQISKTQTKAFDEYLQRELYKAYANAICYDTVCPVQISMARDIFVEVQLKLAKNNNMNMEDSF